MWKKVAVLMAIGAMSTSAMGEASQCDLNAADAASAGLGCEQAWMDRNLKLNDLLMVGTHNSYKTGLPEGILSLIRGADPKGAESLDYRHRPLSEQLDAGARQLEIDILADPEGGRYLDPAGLRQAGLALDPAHRAALADPGFKVLHVPDIDVMSSCVRLRDCLGIVRRWSLAHKGHVPILLMFNAKTDAAYMPGGVDALPFDTATFDALDREVRAVFPEDALITPDDIQGDYPTLRDAVLANAWPTLGEARGKVLFALDEGPEKVALYRGNRQSLEGRVFFVNTDERSPAAAYLTLNNPITDAQRIRDAVKAGFIVRTRADAGTKEARRNDTQRRDAALASGAQYVSTDYFWPEEKWGSDYQVRLSGKAAAQCNPLRAAGRCGGTVVESAGRPGRGYLTPETAPDGLRILPPPPQADGAIAGSDRQIFAETRKLEGSPRWAVATDDVHNDPLERFACALGASLTPESAPALSRLLDRAGTSLLVNPVKQYYRVPRPYIGNDEPICEARTDHLAGNGDYPSGHTANGWMEALILAELAPDRATELLARGRAFGESRLVCGAHSLSAVQAGWMSGAAATAVLHGSPEFRADLEAARAELESLRQTAPLPDAGKCRAEAAALSVRAY